MSKYICDSREIFVRFVYIFKEIALSFVDLFWFFFFFFASTSFISILFFFVLLTGFIYFRFLVPSSVKICCLFEIFLLYFLMWAFITIISLLELLLLHKFGMFYFHLPKGIFKCSFAFFIDPLVFQKCVI